MPGTFDEKLIPKIFDKKFKVGDLDEKLAPGAFNEKFILTFLINNFLIQH